MNDLAALLWPLWAWANYWTALAQAAAITGFCWALAAGGILAWALRR